MAAPPEHVWFTRKQGGDEWVPPFYNGMRTAPGVVGLWSETEMHATSCVMRLGRHPLHEYAHSRWVAVLRDETERRRWFVDLQ